PRARASVNSALARGSRLNAMWAGEVAQYRQADALAFLGVELGGEDVFVPDRGGNRRGIVGGGGDDVIVARDGVVGVDEVDGIAEGADAGENELVGMGDDLGFAADLGIMAEVLKRLLDAAQVGHAVVDDEDAHRNNCTSDWVAACLWRHIFNVSIFRHVKNVP